MLCLVVENGFEINKLSILLNGKRECKLDIMLFPLLKQPFK